MQNKRVSARNLQHLTVLCCAKSLQSCPTLCNPKDCSLQSVHRIFQERILEWVAIPCSKGSNPCPLCLPHWQAGSLPIGPSGKPATSYYMAIIKWFFCIRISSVTQSCPTPCDSMDCSMPGFPVSLPEFTQTHIHRVSDAIQPSHPLSSPSPPTFNLSQHQGLFQWVSSSHQVAKVLEFQLQHQSFQWTPKTDLL